MNAESFAVTLIGSLLATIPIMLMVLFRNNKEHIYNIFYPLKNYKRKKEYLEEKHKHLIKSNTTIEIERPNRGYGQWKVFIWENKIKQPNPLYSISDNQLNKINFD